jgi:hypothetical protein
MTDAWDGRPQNPEQDGAHWITDNVAYWEADRQRWLLMVKAKPVSAGWLAAQPWAEYRGPCLMPAEIERLRAERDRLREALRFYGGHDPDNSDHGKWVERMNEDGGDIARAALGEDRA